MNFPHMLIMRNEPRGMIWQAYTVQTQFEEDLLTRTAQNNGFLVENQPEGYADETWPGWRDTQEWKKYSADNQPKVGQRGEWHGVSHQEPNKETA